MSRSHEKLAGAGIPRVLVESLEEAAHGILSGYPGLKIVVFGSRAAGRPRPTSDVDIGIDAGIAIDSPLSESAPAVLIRRRSLDSSSRRVKT